jgi:2-aminoadipate transaminase
MELYGQYEVPKADVQLNLGVGQPGESIIKAASKLIKLNINDFNILQYGAKSGFKSFRETICFLQKMFTDSDLNPDNIYMTNGISQAVFMLAALYKNLGVTTIYVEDLTYFIMINTFKDLGFNIKTFDLNNLDKLKEDLNATGELKLIYIIPYCNNPTGTTLNKKQIQDFVQLINNNNVKVISDETYQILHFKSTILEYNAHLSLLSDKVISLGTFSKILAPGLRLGWIHSLDKKLFEWLDNTGFMDSGGSVNPLIAYSVVDLIKNRFTEYNTFLFTTLIDLELKSNYIKEVLNKYKKYFEIETNNIGGYFIFVKSKLIPANELLELAKRVNLTFHIGNKFSVTKTYDNYFRLSYSYYNLDDLKKYFGQRIYKLSLLIEYELALKGQIYLLGKGRLGSLIEKELIAKSINFNNITRENMNEINISHSDIIIDVSSPDATMAIFDKLTKLNVYPKLIIGTTGYTEEHIGKIKEYSKNATVLHCSNFSIGIHTICEMFSKLDLNEEWSGHIIDIHHVNKKDSPSGTAKLLKAELEKYFVNVTHIESERVGDVIGKHIIILNKQNETIKLEHNAESRELFAEGCVKFIDKIKKQEVGYYNWI